jgi:hypothetical protein
VLLLGDKGTGKSTLQDTLKVLFGDALFHSSDSTAAGIYQAMGHDSRAVALDEMEPGLDERKASNIADLMRTSASGAIGRRGSAGGSLERIPDALGVPVLGDQQPAAHRADLSRVAVLRMLPFDKDSEKGEPIDAETTGPMILAQMMRAWGDGGTASRCNTTALRRPSPRAATKSAARTPMARCWPARRCCSATSSPPSSACRWGRRRSAIWSSCWRPTACRKSRTASRTIGNASTGS